jgi:DMSO/TMAO reductase YedYZ heme-binding membrane subunit
MLGHKVRPPWLLAVHRFLGGASVAFVAMHIVGVVADSYVHFGWADVLVPMASHWRPGAVAWGIVALYLLVAVEGTSLAMKRLPKRLWRGVHLTSFVLYAMTDVHAVLAGHDARHMLYRAIGLTAIPIVTLLVLMRLVGGRKPSGRKSTGRTPANALRKS